MMKPIRVAVAGLGLGAQRAKGYLQNDNALLCAVCDADLDRLKDFQSQWPGVRGYSNYQLMLETEELDLVNVSTPDWMHFQHVKLALQLDCHVLVEKPMVRNLDEAKMMIDMVETSGKTLMVGQNYRRLPVAVQAKRIVEDNRLGPIFYLSTEELVNKRKQFSQSTWYASAEHPRSALLGTGIHGVDMLRWLMGEVEEAFAYSNHIAYPEFPTDDFTLAIYRFANGAIGQVSVAYSAILPTSDSGFKLRLHGAKGSQKQENIYLISGGKDSWQRGQESLPQNTFCQEVDYLLTCLESYQRPEVDVYEGARNIAACLAGVEAARTGKVVKPERF